MVEFTFEDRTYLFDADTCYSGSGLIRLPDGRLLEVTGGWTETCPPRPVGLQAACFLPGFEPDHCVMATQICQRLVGKIISGGQTGVDQAALDVALDYGIAHGGFIPRGRLTEKGPLDKKYQLEELPTSSYAARTDRNVEISDAVLILSWGILDGGSLRTQQRAAGLVKPYAVVDIAVEDYLDLVRFVNNWLLRVSAGQEITLMVAGPRASKAPTGYARASNFLRNLFARTS